ncbi:palmitoyltransferase ZDHHC19-like [Marmota marmota marmota]|uniref:palmitoyltransferase ZDHHC19-like n=1 Tax=Marmota marmota marmota TaxID=9994 RepID=UPI0007627B22|nr:palmitoyltransferase ZDHHC19-like [Marmota marmota marmota]
MGSSGLPQTRTESASDLRCRWFALNGEWGFAQVIAFLFLVTFGSLVSLNFSNPGILHRGSLEQDPEAAYIAWIYQKAFWIPWCPHCSFHCPPRTFHCEYCNICMEEFDHHCMWVNHYVGHCNSQLFLLLLESLCLYLGAVLVRCIMFLVCTREMPFFLDKAMAYPHSPKGTDGNSRGCGEEGAESQGVV